MDELSGTKSDGFAKISAYSTDSPRWQLKLMRKEVPHADLARSLGFLAIS